MPREWRATWQKRPAGSWDTQPHCLVECGVWSIFVFHSPAVWVMTSFPFGRARGGVPEQPAESLHSLLLKAWAERGDPAPSWRWDLRRWPGSALERQAIELLSLTCSCPPKQD